MDWNSVTTTAGIITAISTALTTLIGLGRQMVRVSRDLSRAWRRRRRTR